VLNFGELCHATSVPAALERRPEERIEDLLGGLRGHYPPPHREHVGVVVATCHLGKPHVVAQRGARAPNLVRRDLLALATSAEDDSHVGEAVANGARHRSADRRIIHRVRRVGTNIIDLVTSGTEQRHEMGLQVKTRVVRANSDARDHSLNPTSPPLGRPEQSHRYRPRP